VGRRDVLKEQCLPVVFAPGYDASAVPETYIFWSQAWAQTASIEGPRQRPPWLPCRLCSGMTAPAPGPKPKVGLRGMAGSAVRVGISKADRERGRTESDMPHCRAGGVRLSRPASLHDDCSGIRGSGIRFALVCGRGKATSAYRTNLVDTASVPRAVLRT